MRGEKGCEYKWGIQYRESRRCLSIQSKDSCGTSTDIRVSCVLCGLLLRFVFNVCFIAIIRLFSVVRSFKVTLCPSFRKANQNKSTKQTQTSGVAATALALSPPLPPPHDAPAAGPGVAACASQQPLAVAVVAAGPDATMKASHSNDGKAPPASTGAHTNATGKRGGKMRVAKRLYSQYDSDYCLLILRRFALITCPRSDRSSKTSWG